MSAEGAAAPGAFSPRVVLALVVVGLLAFSGFAVLSAYAPELRQAGSPGAHALSRSAVGFAAVRALLSGQGVDERVARAAVAESDDVGLLVVTPPPRARASDLKPLLDREPLLIVLPKWRVAPEPARPEFVRKVGLEAFDAGAMLADLAPGAVLSHRSGRSKPVLTGGEILFGEGASLPLGEVDRLQTIAGPGWRPALVDEAGRAVLACAYARKVCVLADPDLLNTQGMKSLDTARAGLAVVNVLRMDGPVVFDVTLQGIQADRNLLKLMLTPPFLGFTLCALAAALAMGWHAAVRFGPTAREARALALGKQALVDNSAGLFRMAGKEHELAPAYVRLTEQMAARAAGGGRAPPGEGERRRWLERIGAGRGLQTDLAALEAEAARARNRHDLLGLARRLHHWRSEMTRDRR